MRPYKPRFHKQIVIDKLTREIDILQREYNFDPNLGWVQVKYNMNEKDNDYRGVVVIVDYGRFRALWDLRESIEEGGAL